jgi:hypothetical protein
MAVPAFLEPLIETIGVPVAQGERVLTSGRGAGVLPKGSRRGLVEWTPRDYAAFLLGCAAPVSIDAADTIAALGGTEFVTSPGAPDDQQQPRLGPGTLQDVLARVIERAAPDHPGLQIPHFIHLGQSRPKATLLWLASNGAPERTEIYAPPGPVVTKEGAFAHTVVMDTTALIQAGAAWRASIASRGGQLSQPTEHENAAPLPGGAAPNRGRTDTRDPGSYTAPTCTQSVYKAQERRPGHSHHRHGSYTHGRNKDSVTASSP